MDSKDLLTKAAYGALTGAAATVAIQLARSANRQYAQKRALTSGTGKPESFVKTIENALPAHLRDRIPQELERMAGSFVPLGFGSNAAALYTSMSSDPALVIDGAALGTAVWAVGRLGWLPALGLQPQPSPQTRAQSSASLLKHLLFGVATVSAYRKLRSATA